MPYARQMDAIKRACHFVRFFGPSGVRALPLAAGIYEGGHYFRYIGPSVLRAPAEQTKVATVLGIFPLLVRACCVHQRSKLRWPLFWSERVACASGAN